MNIQLNRYFETLFLLCLCPWGEDSRSEVKQELQRFGVDGEEFYEQNYQTVERYYQVFTEHLTDSPGVALLKGMEETTISVCAGVLYRYPQWFEDFDRVSEEEARAMVRREMTSECDEDDLYMLLTELAESDTVRWQLILLTEKAKQQFTMIISAVKENLTAFEHAYAAVENEISGYMERFRKTMAAPQRKGLLGLSSQLSPEAEIIPTLALPIAVMVIDQMCFYGLLSDRLISGDEQMSREEMLICAKALSEKSKLEILLCLKGQSRYNLEIAELVGLTPATVSHHMNVLLGSGFVKLEKRDGKVYYRLHDKGVQRYLGEVRKLLLTS